MTLTSLPQKIPITRPSLEKTIQLDKYCVLIYSDGSRDTTHEGKPFVRLTPDTLTWALVDKLLGLS